MTRRLRLRFWLFVMDVSIACGLDRLWSFALVKASDATYEGYVDDASIGDGEDPF